MANSRVPLRERFDANWTPEPNTGCWLWTGAIYAGTRGYGRIKMRGRVSSAHRVAWLLYRGPIPDGMVLDHTCRVRACVNPDHLRVVTPKINSIENSRGVGAINRAKTQCHRGHPFDIANTRIAVVSRLTDGTPKMGRQCRQCSRESHLKRRAASARASGGGGQ